MESPFIRVGVFTPEGHVLYSFIRSCDIRAFTGKTVDRIEWPQSMQVHHFPAPRDVTQIVVVHSSGQPVETLTIAEPLHIFMGMLTSAGQRVQP